MNEGWTGPAGDPPNEDRRFAGDPRGAIDRNRVRHGPYRLRLTGAGIACAALPPAVWLPVVVGGIGTLGAVTAALLGLAFLGLAANGVTLYRLARGYPSFDLPSVSPARQRAESLRLWLLTLVPGALVVAALRPRPAWAPGVG